MNKAKQFTTFLTSLCLLLLVFQVNGQAIFDVKKPGSTVETLTQNSKQLSENGVAHWQSIYHENCSIKAENLPQFKVNDIPEMDLMVATPESNYTNLSRYHTLSENGMPYFLQVDKKIKGAQPEAALREPILMATAFLNNNAELLQLTNPDNELHYRNEATDAKGNTHIRFDQYFQGIPVWASDVVVHTNEKGVYAFNGRYQATPNIENVIPEIAESAAIDIVKSDLESFTKIVEYPNHPFMKHLVSHMEPSAEVKIFKPLQSETFTLVYHIVFSPNIAEHWHYFIDAESGAILKKYNQVCTFGPETAQASDLYGITRTLNTYSISNNYYLIDASRSSFNLSASNLPDEPVGAVVTLDLHNNPVDQFGSWINELTHVESNNNNWNNPTAVSAHYNAGRAYEYFKNTYNRNAIDNQGSTVWSVINVSDDNGQNFDNAFWNGTAMFYGNGNTAFNELPKAIDAAAHEMAHGVTQNSANLIYEFQPGALNESFSDVFGAMVDRDDWRIGEDVSNTSAFPSGAMRDMQNPNNGGSTLGDPGWQPNRMAQYANLNSNQDNGGVHINSGIPNRAFVLFAQQVGKDVAEQVYYHALTNYMTQQSQFVDCRASVIQSALDLYDSTVANAAASAFDTVGIVGEGSVGSGGGQGGTVSGTDLPTINGEEHMLACDYPSSASTALVYDYDFNTQEFEQVSGINAYPKTSVTDDGEFGFYVGNDNHIYAVDLTVAEPFNNAYAITNDPNWRKVAINKEGTLLAALTTENDNAVIIFDVTTGSGTEFSLYNPSTANDGATAGAPEYADAIEFSPFGEFLMYDAYNIVSSTGIGEVGSWDIGLLHVWDKTANNFGDGRVVKLFPPQPSHLSIGNASFAKNSPYIITFDRLDANANSITVMAANLSTGDVNAVHQTNSTIGYPSYSPDDDAIAFSDNSGGDNVIGAIPVGSDKITASGNATIFFTDAAWPVWYKRGQRNWQNPQANFSSNVEEGPAALTVNFYDSSINSPTQWDWTFQGGNPATSNDQNPVVTFDSQGTYNVSLSISNPAGNDTETKNGYITVGAPEPVGIEEEELLINQISNSPNPFSDETTIFFNLTNEAEVQLQLFDVAGKQLAFLLNEKLGKGNHQVKFNAANYPAGIYFCQLSSGTKSMIHKMIIER